MTYPLISHPKIPILPPAMKRCLVIPIFILIFLTVVINGRVSADQKFCIDWPKVMAQYELDRGPKGKIVLVEPFSNYTKFPADDWMAAGIRDYLADLLKSGTNISVLSGSQAAYSSQTGPVAYTVSGKFERLPGRLRVFITLKEGPSGKLLRQLEAGFPYPDNKEFFTNIADSAKQVLETIKTKRDPAAFDRVRNATSSTSAYENYSRGRQIFETFAPSNVDTSAAFFTLAKRDDYRSPLGYTGIVDLNTFLGFYHKQQGEIFGPYFQKAEEEIHEMKRLTGESEASTSSARAKKSGAGIENRFIIGNAAFTEALAATQLGNFAKAAAALKRSVEAVPEDAISWYHLSRALTATADEAGARNALQKALGINPCIEN